MCLTVWRLVHTLTFPEPSFYYQLSCSEINSNQEGIMRHVHSTKSPYMLG